MDLLTRLERKFGRYAIPNLSLYIVVTYAAGYLQELVEHRPGEAHGEYVIAQPLADAPEGHNGDSHVDHLAAELGDDGHNCVADRVPYAFKRV